SCSVKSKPVAEAKQRSSSKMSAISTSMVQFSVNLFQNIPNNSTSNVFFSPLSVFTALALTLGGAADDTADQIAAGLGINTNDECVHESLGMLQSEVIASDGVIVNVANKLFTKEGKQLKQAFLDLAKTAYKSNVEALDFAAKSDESRQIINKWVEAETNDKIKDLIPEGTIDRDTIMCLVNAIYFKGSWKDMFDQKNTRKENFFVTPEKSVEVDMMNRNGEYGFGWDGDLEVSILELPYNKEEISMFLVLPSYADGFPKLISQLTADFFTKATRNLHKTEVNVAIPKFKLEETINLDKILTKVGINDLFTRGKANLSGIVDTGDLYVSKFVHKAAIEVNEEGSEAAAASAVTFASFSMPPQFTADHPFLFFIRHNKSGVILFQGAVTNPLE
ncbi:unnamed protein product, partial [Owenia fusiformis]